MINNNVKIGFLFSGQGSHYRKMGQKLFENNNVFKQSLITSDSIIQKNIDRSLIYELYKETNPTFDDLLITHPAIVAIEIAMYTVMEDLGVFPDYVCGNSLGEFAAGVASGIWDARSALEASIEQAKSIVRENTEGGMITVFREGISKLNKLYTKHNLYLASSNFSGHNTFSGLKHDIEAFKRELKKLNLNHVQLPVNYPFHSPLIKNAKHGFDYFMSHNISLSTPRCNYYSGADGRQLSEFGREYFWDVISRYNNISKTVESIESNGEGIYIDLGPSGTMATFVQYNINKSSKSKVFKIMTPFQQEEIQLERFINEYKINTT
ncbi:acyltransferase domain-containing protein [uncultured Aquimarina sp.]|uniref:acyltransferase domain-containing protein n=1 Tax=uncultured Aquimarina sp. TaxID=575652 RepID=UPI002626289F|nr:acyltransferase domain-containing protein [uncultured Aquimarina sp.]